MACGSPSLIKEGSISFSALCPEAFEVLKATEKAGVALGASPYDVLVKALLSEGNLEDAMVVRDM